MAAAIQAACFNNKLLLEKGGRNGTVIRLLCPLIITQDECVEAVARFKKAIAEALCCNSRRVIMVDFAEHRKALLCNDAASIADYSSAMDQSD